MLYADITRNILGAAMEVHTELGCGFLETVYEEALAIEFDLRKIPYQRQKAIDILYKGRCAKHFICDFLVEKLVLVEIKATNQITAIEDAQVLNYLKATGIKIGLLINFGQSSLKYKRLILG